MTSILWLIYLAEVCNALTALCVALGAFCFACDFIFGVNLLADKFDSKEEKLLIKKLVKYFAVAWVTTAVIVVFLPSKEVLLGAASAQAIEFIQTKDQQSPAVGKALKLLDKQLDSVLNTKEEKKE